MTDYISRPPFNEKGFAVYEGHKKKRQPTPLRWIIPAGVAVVVLLIVLLAMRPKEAAPFCRKAVKNAITGSIGSGDPLLRAMGLGDMRETLESRNYDLDSVLSVRGIDAGEDTRLYSLLEEFGMKPEDVPAGVGLAIGLESGEDTGKYGKVSVAYSGIQLPVLKGWWNDHEMTLSSSRLSDAGLSFVYSELLDGWQDNTAWLLIEDEEKREEIRSKAQDIVNGYKIKRLISQFIDGRSPMEYFGKGFDAAMDALLSRISFEEAKNASGRPVQEKIYVGGEHLLCYGYHAELETEEICKRIRTVTGLAEANLHCVEDSQTTEAMLFITRRGELISLDFSLKLVVFGEEIPLSFSYKASGSRNPHDHFTIDMTAYVKEKPINLVVTKNTTKNAYSVRSVWSATVSTEDEEGSVTISSDYENGNLTVKAGTTLGGNSVGGLEAAAKVTNGEEFALDFRNMKFRDTFTGTSVDLSWKLSVKSREGEFSGKLPKLVHDVNRMNEEEWREFYDEVETNLDTYLGYLEDLF